MASLRKKPTSKAWFACFTDRVGKRRQRSTGTSDRRKAQRIADEYEKAARNQATARQARRVMLDLHRELTGEDLPVTSVERYAADWLARKAGTVAESTLSSYRISVELFLKFLGEDGTKGLTEIEERHLSAFRDDLAKRLRPTTANQHVKKVGLMFTDAVRGGWIPDNPMKNLRSLKKPAYSVKARRPFTVDEVKRVLAVPDPEWHSMVLFGIYTGQRLGDLARLRWHQIDVAAGDVSFVTGKTGRRVLVPMCAPLREHVLSLPSADDPEAFVHPEIAAIQKAGGITGSLSNQFAKILTVAGLREVVPRAKAGERIDDTRSVSRVSFHSLRHSAVSWMKNAGVSPAIVQDVVGHDSAEMSAHYTVIDRDAKAEALGRMPDLTSPGDA